jgi:hypothetical protein
MAEGEVMGTPATLLADDEAGLATFVAVGEALSRIKDQRTYRAAGFSDFNDYCRQRWSMPRTYAYELMGAARIAQIVVDHGLPAPSATVTRPLIKLRNDVGHFDRTRAALTDPQAAEDAVVDAWRRTVDAHDPARKAISTSRSSVLSHRPRLCRGLRHGGSRRA